MLVSVLIFTLVVSYVASLPPQTAVGTSVFIMTFTALTGAVSNFTIGGGITDYSILILCIIFYFESVLCFTAKIANKTSPKEMNRTLGLGLAAMSITIPVALIL